MAKPAGRPGAIQGAFSARPAPYPRTSAYAAAKEAKGQASRGKEPPEPEEATSSATSSGGMVDRNAEQDHAREYEILEEM